MAAAVEKVELEHLPATHTVLLALYRDVANAGFLQEQLLSRNVDFEYAFVDASAVASRFQLLSAVHKAIAAEMAGISEAYRRYGVQPATKDVAVVKVLISREGAPSSLSPEDVEKHLQAHVQGESVACSDEELAKVTDWPKLRKYHKLNGLPWIDAIKDEAARKSELEMLIVSAMAMRGT
ncbi:hypothetical protein PG993_009046 [Apiospora rasikravindrae]|uniref:EKC/KEOPS complex subunit CGI121 n=1 Tax=Apiospora rasikravindrae TaxID=990691 RepID=A0ABR1SI98_9PEZI